MSEVLDWSSFGSGAFVKFEQVGDKAEGVITGIRAGEDFNGHPCPVIDLRTADGEDRTITCGQANLKAQVTELGKAGKLAKGKHLSVEFSSTAKAEKGTKKVFTVTVDDAAASAAADSKPPF
jgi:hypothetical protein